MSSRIGPSHLYDSAVPPGMIDGPLSAPSSPPETPVPTKCRPCSRRAFSRRIVSGKWALPASMTMSPSSRSGISSSMTASVGPPALTMMTTLRGRSSEATKSAMDSDGRNAPSWPASSIRDCVLAYERLCTATVYPWRAKLRARLRPMTARPVTPIWALPPTWAAPVVSLIVNAPRRRAVCRPRHGLCWRQARGERRARATWASLVRREALTRPMVTIRARRRPRAARLRCRVGAST